MTAQTIRRITTLERVSAKGRGLEPMIEAGCWNLLGCPQVENLIAYLNVENGDLIITALH